MNETFKLLNKRHIFEGLIDSKLKELESEKVEQISFHVVDIQASEDGGTRVELSTTVNDYKGSVTWSDTIIIY